MRSRTWPILAIAFGSVIALIAITGLGALQRARRIYGEVSTLNDRHHRAERTVHNIQTEIHLSGILVRDFLLDPSHLSAASYREQLLDLRASMPKELDQLRDVIGAEGPKMQRLREELEAYWDSLDPLFEWTPAQKVALSSLFLRRQVLPRRNAVLDMAREIRDLHRAELELQRRNIARKESELPVFVRQMLTMTIALGLLVAGASIYRLNKLERKSEAERERAETAERELRLLSQQLVKAQEEERRSISRELHDEVGQMLTAQRMELRNLKELRTAPERAFQERVEEVAQLSEQALRVVRDLAMGLRPSMLDDLGLGPAVEWQARDFSRRYGVPVTVQLEGAVDSLPDAHRTCVYRVVQEALTNCARHAQAKEIRVTIHGREDSISMTIQDDGIGFNAAAVRGRGLGLLGIEERVRELNGKVSIISQKGKGTVISVEFPVQREHRLEAASV